MSAICGIFRPDAPHGAQRPPNDERDAAAVSRMLESVRYRGDLNTIHASMGLTLGVRMWQSRQDGALHSDESSLLGLAGNLAIGGVGTSPSIAQGSDGPLSASRATPGQRAQLGIHAVRTAFGTTSHDADIDGAFAFAWVDQDGRRLRLARDPFGVCSLYYFVGADAVYFASELKQLLTLPECPREIDLAAIHKYLTFSFVPGEAVPIVGIKRVLPGHVASFTKAGAPESRAYFSLEEREQERYLDRTTAVEALRELAKAAVSARVAHGEPVALYLSGGLDSAAMAVWLKSRGTETTLLTLDFGIHNSEREEAESVAKTVGFKHEMVKVTGHELADKIPSLASMLDLPFGDSVTGPQMMLGIAARERGLHHVLNGEGGDQLFGGWTNKPMIAAEIFGGIVDDEEGSREETYLRSYHRFYGVEDALYTDAFRHAVGGPGQRRAHLMPYLSGERGESFLSRVRLADIALKGSQNILPRAERIAAGLGLAVSMPLFDRKLAEYSFHLPAEMKLSGACEKFVLKIAMQGRLPEEIVWRKKSGMSVPMTDWLLGPAGVASPKMIGRVLPAANQIPLRDVLEEYAGSNAVASRGWFQKDYVAQLREGRDKPGETRRRRVGEKLWALIMLEAWVRHVVEGKSV